MFSVEKVRGMPARKLGQENTEKDENLELPFDY